MVHARNFGISEFVDTNHGRCQFVVPTRETRCGLQRFGVDSPPQVVDACSGGDEGVTCPRCLELGNPLEGYE